MAKIISLPNGQTAEFPDDMSNGDIEAVLRRQFPPTSSPAPAPAPINVDPTEGMSGWEKALVGAGHRFDQMYRGVRNLLPGQSNSAEEIENEKLYKKNEKGLGWQGTAGEIVPDLLITAPLGGGASLLTKAAALKSAPVAASNLTKALISGGSTVAGNAATGAALNADDRAGAAFNEGAGALAGMGLQRAVGGLFRTAATPEARALMREGIQPTVGQTLGGAPNTFESKLTVLPLAGEAIASARHRTQRELNERLLREAEGLTGDAATQGLRGAPGTVGDEALSRVRTELGQGFDEVLDRVGNIAMHPQPIIDSTTNVMRDAALDLNNASRQRLSDYVSENLLSHGRPYSAPPGMQAMLGPSTGPQPMMIGADVAKRIESDMGQAARKAMGSESAEERAYGMALNRIHSEWRDNLMRSLPPEDATRMADLNARWRAFVPLDNAASRIASQSAETSGVFSPRVLRQAIALGDKSQFDNATRAAAAARDMSTPFNRVNTIGKMGEEVAGKSSAGAGAEGRSAFGLAAAMGALALGGPKTAAAALGTVAASHLGYSRLAQQLLTQGIIPEKQVVRFTQWLASKGVDPDVALERLPAYFGAFTNETN